MMLNLSLTPELRERLVKITCEDYEPLIVSLAKTIENAEVIITFMEIASAVTGLEYLTRLPQR